jgi:hypothetical protein
MMIVFVNANATSPRFATSPEWTHGIPTHHLCVQQRCLEKEAIAKAIVDGLGVRSILTEADSATWEYTPLDVEAAGGGGGGAPVATCACADDAQALRDIAAGIDGAVGAGTVAQVRVSVLRIWF